MRKIFFISPIIAILIVSISTTSAYSQEYSVVESSWDQMSKDFENLNFAKPVSKDEFNSALDSVKNGNKKKKSKNKKGKKIDGYKTGDHQKLKFNNSNTSNTLLRLPYDIYYNNTVLNKGFYLLKPVKKGNLSYLNFIQGTKTIALIQMSGIDLPVCKNELNCVKLKMVDGQYLMLIYKNLNETLIKYFHIADR